MIRMYRIQSKTIREISEMYFCYVGLVHKIINKNRGGILLFIVWYLYNHIKLISILKS